MELPSIVLAAVGALAGPGASVWVARAAAGKTLADLDKRIAHLETTDPPVVVKMQAELAELRKALEERARDDEKRREVVVALRVEIAALTERLNERTSALSARMEERNGRR
jgi:predicted  nucleic acid-binding Zn-ribbon protein